MRNSYPIAAGTPGPAGVQHTAERTNFAIYSRRATGMALLLYRSADDGAPFQEIVLSRPESRDAFTWHVAVLNLPAGTHYNWRVTHEGWDGGRSYIYMPTPGDPFVTTVVISGGRIRGIERVRKF